jgi:hypothetical protein
MKPVCGMDGKTYTNDCLAKCQNVRILKAGKCVDCKKVLCAKSLCPNGSKRVRVDDNCCGCRKNPVCPAVRTLLTKTGLWSNKKSWQNDLIPKKVDVATVTKSSAKFYLVAGKGDVALDLRIQNNNADLVVGKAKQGSLIIGPDKNVDLCTGTTKCNMDKLSLKKGFLGSYYGGLESIDANGKIVSASARGIQISCKKDWQQVKGDKKKIYTCGMVNNLLDGFKPVTQCNQEKCAQTCQKKTCDEWTKKERYTCKELGS